MFCWLKELVYIFNQVITIEVWKYIEKISNQYSVNSCSDCLGCKYLNCGLKNYWTNEIIENQCQFLNQGKLYFSKNGNTAEACKSHSQSLCSRWMWLLGFLLLVMSDMLVHSRLVFQRKCEQLSFKNCFFPTVNVRQELGCFVGFFSNYFWLSPASLQMSVV